MLQRKMELTKWVYLVGERPEILKLTQSLGFYFVKQGKNNYIHPNVMIVLSGQGRPWSIYTQAGPTTKIERSEYLTQTFI